MTFTEQVTLAKVVCGKCGGVYAISERVRKHREDNGGFWNCPYCGILWGYPESQISRLEKQLSEAQAAARAAKCETFNERNLKEQAEKKLATVGTKLRRVNNGVCPCCKRSFQNLRRHMVTKHPHENYA